MKKFLGKALAALTGLTLTAGAVAVMPEVAMAANHDLLIGATMEKDQLPYWKPKLVKNSIMRVFPDGDGTIANVSDARFAYADEINMRQIFVSTKIRDKWVRADGKTFSSGVTKLVQDLTALYNTGNFDTIWVADHHEAEANYAGWYGSLSAGATQFKADQIQIWNAINAMPSSVRSHIKFGHIATKQWTESSATGKGNFNYKTFDAGIGDFWGVDAYVNSNSGSNVITTLDSSVSGVASWLNYIKTYKFNSSDTRLRIFPELGVIGFPADTTGSMRAAWIQEVHNQVRTWDATSTGWHMAGWIWWNGDGTHGATLSGNPGIGDARYFQLDRRHTGSNNFQVLSNPLALVKWNAISTNNN